MFGLKKENLSCEAVFLSDRFLQARANVKINATVIKSVVERTTKLINTGFGGGGNFDG